ncbi:MAG: hypothetical protein NVSMB22_07970 [Chloroflexota bacterium]
MNPERLADLAQTFARTLQNSTALQGRLQEHRERMRIVQQLLASERIPTLDQDALVHLFLQTDAVSRRNFRNKYWEADQRLTRLGVDRWRDVLQELVTRGERGLTPDDLQHLWSTPALAVMLTSELLLYRFPNRYWKYHPTDIAWRIVQGEEVDPEALPPANHSPDPHTYLMLKDRLADVREALHVAMGTEVDNILADVFLTWIEDEVAPRKPRRRGPRVPKKWLYTAEPEWVARLPVRPGESVEWALERYRWVRTTGDQVVIWQTGDRPGIRAIADLSVTGSWESVKLTYTRYLEQPIEPWTLRADPVLKDLAVLRSSRPRAYRLSEEQWDAISQLVEREVAYPAPDEIAPRSAPEESPAVSDPSSRREPHLAPRTTPDVPAPEDAQQPWPQIQSPPGNSIEQTGALVFVSYVEHDEPVARAIVEGIEAAGFRAWSYTRDVIPGLHYVRQILTAIKECDFMIVIVSAESLDSQQVEVEVLEAYERHKKFLPLLLNVSHADLTEQREDWAMLFRATSARIPAEGVKSIMPRIVKGLEMMRPRGMRQ